MRITTRYLVKKALAQVIILTALAYMVMAEAQGSGLTRFDWLVA